MELSPHVEGHVLVLASYGLEAEIPRGVFREDVTLPQDSSFRDFLMLHAQVRVRPFLGHVMVPDI